MINSTKMIAYTRSSLFKLVILSITTLAVALPQSSFSQVKDGIKIDDIETKDIDVGQEAELEQPSIAANAERIAKSIASMDVVELATYELVNKYRKTHNLAPLIADFDIAAQAKAHSEDMARRSNINHTGFFDRVASVAKTIVYRKASENVGYSQGYGKPALIVIEDWIGSPRHRKNMLGRYDLTGIGVARNDQGTYYFTQIFVLKAWYVKDSDDSKIE
jgi:uncharacterized protein YkwD